MLLIKSKIRGKHKENEPKQEKKVKAESILCQKKKWSGARRPAGPATTALCTDTGMRNGNGASPNIILAGRGL